jgi:hypothetical protein
MILEISEEIGHLDKDNEILKIKMDNITAVERSSVSHMQEPFTRREVMSSAALRNNTVKTFRDASSGGCVSLHMDPVVSVDLVLSATSRVGMESLQPRKW